VHSCCPLAASATLSCSVTKSQPHRSVGRAVELEDFLVYRFNFIGGYDPAVEDAGLIDAAFRGHSRSSFLQMPFMAGSRRDEPCDQLNNAGNLGTGNRVNVSNGSSQSARKNTASVSAELIANSCMSSEHFGQLAWQFERMSGSSGLKVQAAIAC